MYLTKKNYVKNWSHDDGPKYTVLVKKGDEPAPGIDPKRVTYVEEEVAYWRKANAIHSWFVKNVQSGQDDCGTYEVSREQLADLLSTVRKVLQASKLVKAKVTNGYKIEKAEDGTMKEVPMMEDGKRIADPTVAKELLPTQEGFFFGGLDYDQYYHDDLVGTEKALKRALTEKSEGAFFEYHSSW